MGPPPFGDGNPADTQHRPILKGRFNGATAFRRWKLPGHVDLDDVVPRASMGPPPFGDGNWRERFNGATAFRRWKPWCRLPSRRSGRGFNGATAFRRWKLALWSVLQWGHRLSAMETPPACAVSSASISMLQWGHRLSAMETIVAGSRRSSMKSLQWGHRLSAMETPPSR